MSRSADLDENIVKAIHLVKILNQKFEEIVEPPADSSFLCRDDVLEVNLKYYIWIEGEGEWKICNYLGQCECVGDKLADLKTMEAELNIQPIDFQTMDKTGFLVFEVIKEKRREIHPIETMEAELNTQPIDFQTMDKTGFLVFEVIKDKRREIHPIGKIQFDDQDEILLAERRPGNLQPKSAPEAFLCPFPA
jgi:hypothetical protein